MYPECRHVRPSGGTCNSPALTNSNFCYYHGRLHQHQSARHAYRGANGRFAALTAPQDSVQTIDYGPYPVGAPSTCHPEQGEGPAVRTAIELPAIEDAASLQLALMDVLHAIAANHLDPKRAGLLLYGLQVASANIKNIKIPLDAVRTLDHTEDGTPLAPQDYGYDVEDYDEEQEEEYDKEEE